MTFSGGPAAERYQGMIFFRPFFFLLVDSFLGSVVRPSAGFAVASVDAPAAGVAVESELVAAAGGLSLGGAVVPLVESGALAGAVPAVSPVSTVEPPEAPLPGVATSTTAVFPVAPFEPPTPTATEVFPPPLNP